MNLLLGRLYLSSEDWKEKLVIIYYIFLKLNHVIHEFRFYVLVMPETKVSPPEKPSHPIKSGSSVFITNFENFDSIFIRDASYEFIENFNVFNKQMLKYYRNGIFI